MRDVREENEESRMETEKELLRMRCLARGGGVSSRVHISTRVCITPVPQREQPHPTPNVKSQRGREAQGSMLLRRFTIDFFPAHPCAGHMSSEQ